jgi:predicted nucleotidyltransferase
MTPDRLAFTLPAELIAGFCARHHIRRMWLFGSVLRADFRADSDIDVLVEFDPAHVPGLIRLEQMQLELAETLGRSVDLVTPKSLHPSIRERVLAEAQAIYDAA